VLVDISNGETAPQFLTKKINDLKSRRDFTPIVRRQDWQQEHIRKLIGFENSGSNFWKDFE
jgi:hypothetical protein